jgi:hypothetical protein
LSFARFIARLTTTAGARDLVRKKAAIFRATKTQNRRFMSLNVKSAEPFTAGHGDVTLPYTTSAAARRVVRDKNACVARRRSRGFFVVLFARFVFFVFANRGGSAAGAGGAPLDAVASSPPSTARASTSISPSSPNAVAAAAADARVALARPRLAAKRFGFAREEEADAASDSVPTGIVVARRAKIARRAARFSVDGGRDAGHRVDAAHRARGGATPTAPPCPIARIAALRLLMRQAKDTIVSAGASVLLFERRNCAPTA